MFKDKYILTANDSDYEYIKSQINDEHFVNVRNKISDITGVFSFHILGILNKNDAQKSVTISISSKADIPINSGLDQIDKENRFELFIEEEDIFKELLNDYQNRFYHGIFNFINKKTGLVDKFYYLLGFNTNNKSIIFSVKEGETEYNGDGATLL